MKNRLRLIRVKPNFYKSGHNPNISLGIFDFSLYTRRIALRDGYHKKRTDKLACTPVQFYNLEYLAKVFIIPSKWNQFIQKNIFNNAPVRCIGIAMKWNSAFSWSKTKNTFWYQKNDLRQIRILRGGQPIVVDFDAAENCRLYLTTRKAMNSQDDIPAIPIDKFKDHHVLVFDFTSMRDPIEKIHYPELVG